MPTILTKLVWDRDMKGLEEALKHKKEPINMPNTNCGNVTALHVACEEGYPEMVTLLLQNGADMFALTRFDETPAGLMLMMAKRHAQRDDNRKQQEYLDCLALLLAQDRVRRAQGLASLLGDKGCGEKSLLTYIGNRLKNDDPPHPIYFKFKKMVEEHLDEARLEAEAKKKLGLNQLRTMGQSLPLLSSENLNMHRMKAHSPSGWSFKQLFSSLYRLVVESEVSKPNTYHPQEETKPLLEKKMQ